MESVFAISLQAQVEKYGAYVGIAAFFGLAVLAVLYFAQAREVKRLREWAGRSPERAQELEERVLEQADQARPEPARAPGAQPSAAPAAALAVPASSRAVGAIPAAATAAGAVGAVSVGGAASATGSEGPAPSSVRTEAAGDETTDDAAPTEAVTGGVAADAAADDAAPTEAVTGGVTAGADADGPPAPAVVSDDASDASPAPAREDALPAAAAPAPKVAAAAATAGADASATGAPPRAPVGAAATAGVSSPGVATVPSAAATGPPRPPSSTAMASSNGGTDAQAPPLPSAPRPAVAVPSRTPAGSRTPRAYGAATAARRAGTPAPERRDDRSRRSTGLIIGAIVMALAALVFLGTQLLGGGREPAVPVSTVPGRSDPGTSAVGAPAGGARPSPAATRSRTPVAVFNGTTTTGLALSMAERLQSSGYPEGAATGNFTPDPAAPDQSREVSSVYYAAGQRAQARDVGRLLGIPKLQPIDGDLQRLAPNAKVLVVAGADKTR